MFKYDFLKEYTSNKVYNFELELESQSVKHLDNLFDLCEVVDDLVDDKEMTPIGIATCAIKFILSQKAFKTSKEQLVTLYASILKRKNYSIHSSLYNFNKLFLDQHEINTVSNLRLSLEILRVFGNETNMTLMNLMTGYVGTEDELSRIKDTMLALLFSFQEENKNGYDFYVSFVYSAVHFMMDLYNIDIFKLQPIMPHGKAYFHIPNVYENIEEKRHQEYNAYVENENRFKKNRESNHSSSTD
jgi:Ni,Fe-hydrogenase I large subunit